MYDLAPDGPPPAAVGGDLAARVARLEQAQSAHVRQMIAVVTAMKRLEAELAMLKDAKIVRGSAGTPAGRTPAGPQAIHGR